MSILGPAGGIVAALDHYTKEVSIESQTKHVYYPLRPSAAGECARALAYGLMEYLGYAEYKKESREPNVHRLLDLGHAVEPHIIKHFQAAFRKAKEIDGIDIRIKYQQQVLSFFEAGGRLVEGSIDSTFVSEEWGMLIDYKTKKDKFSNFYRTDWDNTAWKLKENKFVEEFDEDAYYIEDLEGFLAELDDPFWQMNFVQLNLYFHDSGRFLRERGIDCAALIYYNKNDSRMREIRFKPSEAVYNQVKDKFQHVADVVMNTKDPENVKRDYQLGSIKCAFCTKKESCWGSEDTLRAYFLKAFPRKKWPTDSRKLKCHKELESVYEKYKVAEINSKELKKLESEIIGLLEDNTGKVKMNDGLVYEVKPLKAGPALRRTK